MLRQLNKIYVIIINIINNNISRCLPVLSINKSKIWNRYNYCVTLQDLQDIFFFINFCLGILSTVGKNGAILTVTVVFIMKM